MNAFPPDALTDASLLELVTTASSEPVMDAADESRLVQLLGAGQAEALQTLIRANVRVVIDEAIRDRGLGEHQADMVRRGLEALVESAQAYDPSTDGPFSAFARDAVRRAIRRYASH